MEQRDNKGRFAQGHGGGSGRPKKATEETYLLVTAAACSPDQWQEIVKRAVKDAKDGDYQARAFLAKFLIGDPGKKAAPDLSGALARKALGKDPVEEQVRELASEEFRNSIFSEGMSDDELDRAMSRLFEEE